MARYKIIIFLAIGCFLLNSCEKVIEFDLAGSNSVVVIEANLTNNKMPVTVLVSKTSSYFGSNAGTPVSGAKVSVKIENGIPKYLTEVQAGVYRLEKIFAQPGFWYVIEVVSDGVTYSAKSFLNRPVPIINLTFSYFDGFGFFDSGYMANCFVRDPAETDNYYRIKYYVDGKPVSEQNGITLFSDELFNGNEIGLSHQSFVFNETDTLTVELQSIDRAAYNYFSTLEDISGPSWQQNAAPANPNSNFNNGALGYFSAYSYERKTLVVKDFLESK